MKTLYFDCFSGISGDMVFGAFLDLGLPRDFLETELRKLPFGEFQIEVKEVERGGIRGKAVFVSGSGGSHQERAYRDIEKGISGSGLSTGAKETSLRFFRRLALAESLVHGTVLEEVTFHEIGAIDSIVDLVGAAVALDYYRPRRVLASELPLGRGFVEAAHSRLPLPAPATLEILKGVPTLSHPVSEETVTPTGAAIIREAAQGFGGYPPMQIEAVGYGAGTRESPSGIPNLLRIVLGLNSADWDIDEICQVETTLDDMNPEIFAGLRGELEQAGALDVSFLTVQGKKERPAVVVQALCREADRDRVVEALFQGSSTSGVRFRRLQRFLLPRRQETVTTPWGELRVKIIEGKGDGGAWIHPEYDDLLEIAAREKVPLLRAEKMVKEYLAKRRT